MSFDFQSARTRTIVKYISDFSKINVRGMKSVMDSTTVSESDCCSIPKKALASNINRRIAKPVYGEWSVSVVLMDPED